VQLGIQELGAALRELALVWRARGQAGQRCTAGPEQAAQASRRAQRRWRRAGKRSRPKRQAVLGPGRRAAQRLGEAAVERRQATRRWAQAVRLGSAGAGEGVGEQRVSCAEQVAARQGFGLRWRGAGRRKASSSARRPGGSRQQADGARLRRWACERLQQAAGVGASASATQEVAQVKASRPLIRVLVINDNGLWINNSF
jgi:hypothetical protein